MSKDAELIRSVTPFRWRPWNLYAELAVWRSEIEARLPALVDGYATARHRDDHLVDPDWMWSTRLLDVARRVRNDSPTLVRWLVREDVSQSALDTLYMWGVIDIDFREGDRVYLRVNGETAGAIVGALEDGDGARAYELAAPAMRDWLTRVVHDERAKHAEALSAQETRLTALWRAEVNEMMRARQHLEGTVAELNAQIAVARTALVA
jgi:hypothetical protein